MLETYKLNDRNFREISEYVYELTGIHLKENKRSLVVSRLSKRLRELGMNSFDEYYRYLTQSAMGKTEMENFINSITTNKTDFFRESYHFDFLAEILPKMQAEGDRTGRRKLRIWSSASSTGEEPYTIAMVVHDAFMNKRGWDVKILASDIDTNVLRHGSNGVYKKELLTPIPSKFRQRYFSVAPGSGGNLYQVSPELRQMIIFRRINLINDDFRFKDQLDIIFCRNVVIYFDDAGKKKLVDKFHNVLREGGYVFVGHSESFMMAREKFRFLRSTVYQKV